MLFETRKELKKRSFLKEIDKDSCQLTSSENINDLEMDIEDSRSEIINPLENVDDNINPLENADDSINPLENVDDNIENLKDNDIEIEQFEATDTQLYGKNFEAKMVHLKDNFYCRNIIYYAAIGNSHRSSQIARRLLTGVFKKETLINCTLTGQTPRSQGKDRQNLKISYLHPFAIKAIVDFSIEYGAKHGWIIQTKKDLHRAITQRIGEIKREARNNE
ncbi:uncharacterized protein [Linepithema humile]